MWRGVLLSTLCLIACHRPPAAPPQAPTPTAAATETRVGESALTAGPDAGAAVAPRPPPATTEPRTGRPDEARGEAEDRCTRDEDCALTQLATEGCCPQCSPRALSTASLARLKQACAGVSEASCPMPACRPPPGVPTAACASGRCTVRFTSME
ncbi:hypothetical protein NR798_17770 [Archangium gephyra]|uniref:hypothetical protein n=1 Tax=Archangium gephyra TaxID=48 RepID=UPI0035D3F8E2